MSAIGSPGCVLCGLDHSLVVSSGYSSPYIEAGTTKFSKLRITLEESRVEVIRDDYTFARTTGPNAIPYGHAGDCYSRVQGCARGTFKVDLTGTELSLAPDTHWKLSERYPASLTVHDMFFSEDRKVASAFCGGWCGHCWPVGDNLYLAYPIRSGSCPHPPVITGATLSGCDYPYEENEVCTYSCDSGFFWEAGDRSRACRGGNWEGSALVCSNQYCYWEGTAFFCNPGGCDYGSYVRSDKCGDGGCCWTGHKIYCCTGV
ncbi:hypothetical protein Bbelb_343380 [Branchiostoma belcheri]|nr:hypothetical protein Bbelb_343380 [Branchiostoma belcheri]